MSNEQSPEDIPKEELVQLCMKMNKRMQAMETKGKELVARKKSLLAERTKLVDIIKNAFAATVTVVDEQDLDIKAIESHWQTWDANRQSQISELERKIRASEEALSEMESKHRRELAAAQKAAASTAVPAPSGGDVAASSAPAVSSQELEDLNVELENALKINKALKDKSFEMQSRVTKLESELERLRASDTSLKNQLGLAEAAILEKNKQIEDQTKELESCKLVFEEKLLSLQMQSNTLKGKDETVQKEAATLKKQVDKLTAQCAALQQMNEEKELSVKSNREMIAALQERLISLEPELAQARERLKDYERNHGATTLLKAEQDALINSLRRDLKMTLDEKNDMSKRTKELEEFRVKAEGQLLKMAGLNEQVNQLSESVEEKNSLITRLRSEAQVSERNHAMRTAMLATCEAELETIGKQVAAKEEAVKEAQERVNELQAALTAAETRLSEQVREASEAGERASQQAATAAAAHAKELRDLRAAHEEAIEALKKDHAKKSSMARALLTEREEEVRILTARNQEMQEEISSGAPSERKIFELAKAQASREATYSKHSDTREMAFQQLQSALASKDLELAHNQHSLSVLTAEVMELRRTHKRDGINMDYLKNVVLQFMTLPIDSTEKTSLVRVIATLLQFTPKELMTVQQFDPKPQWSLFGGSGSSKPAKDISKRSTVRVAGASIMPHKGTGGGGPAAAAGVVGGAAGAGGVSGSAHAHISSSSSSSSSSGGGVALNGHNVAAAAAGLRKDSADEREFRAKLEKLNVTDILNMSGSADEATSGQQQQQQPGVVLTLATPRVQFSV